MHPDVIKAMTSAPAISKGLNASKNTRTTQTFLKIIKNYGIQDSRFKNVRKHFLGILNLES